VTSVLLNEAFLEGKNIAHGTTSTSEHYADELRFYWIDDFLEGATLAATLERGKGMTTVDAKAMEKFTQKYDKDRKNEPSLLPLSTFIENYVKLK
jgi:hypothetical protein